MWWGKGSGVLSFTKDKEETRLVLEGLGFWGILKVARLWDGTLYAKFRGHPGLVSASRASCMTPGFMLNKDWWDPH